MILRYTDKALSDIELALEWYERQRRGLGFEFLDCIEVALNHILRYPEMYTTYGVRFRRCIIRRFPFSIFYTIENNTIIIHAVFDNRQDPKKMP